MLKRQSLVVGFCDTRISKTWHVLIANIFAGVYCVPDFLGLPQGFFHSPITTFSHVIVGWKYCQRLSLPSNRFCKISVVQPWHFTIYKWWSFGQLSTNSDPFVLVKPVCKGYPVAIFRFNHVLRLWLISKSASGSVWISKIFHDQLLVWEFSESNSKPWRFVGETSETVLRISAKCL